MKYQELFTPVKVGSITIKNRFAMAPMGPLGLADATAAGTSAELTTMWSGPRAGPD